MNTMMWDHPITKPQLDILSSWNVGVVGPISKTLVCGDKGLGAMSEVHEIVAAVKATLERSDQ
jgi:phosphopantothenoylcysteine decarboxylase